MKALITGCAGFIGSHLTDHLLESGYKVIGIDCFTDYYSKELKKANITSALRNENFKFIEKNILDIDKYPEVDYIFHMAAQAGVRTSWGKNFHIYTKNNLEATQKLLEYYKDLKIKKFIYSSSSSVYGNSKLPMHEKSPLKPISPYGVSKLAAENLCYLYWKHYNIPTVSLRYFTVYGPRQRPDMAVHKFVKSILKNEKIVIYGDGEQTRDFTYIDDVINAIVLFSKIDISGEVFNVGGGSRISINELIKEIEYVLKTKAIIKFDNNQNGDVRNTCADLNKIKNTLNWKPQVNIQKGIENYINWIKNGEILLT